MPTGIILIYIGLGIGCIGILKLFIIPSASWFFVIGFVSTLIIAAFTLSMIWIKLFRKISPENDDGKR